MRQSTKRLFFCLVCVCFSVGAEDNCPPAVMAQEQSLQPIECRQLGAALSTMAMQAELMEKVSANRLEGVVLLINKGVDVNFRDIAGFTPLIIAARKNYLQIVEALLKAGARPDIADDYGQTPLMFTRDAGVIALLIRYKANVNIQDKRGMTPLMHMIVLNEPEAIKLLLAAGAQVAIKDKSGKSSLDYAQKNTEILAILQGNAPVVPTQQAKAGQVVAGNAVLKTTKTTTKKSISSPVDDKKIKKI